MTLPVNTSNFLHHLESILEIDEGSLKGDELLTQLSWDSMCVVLFMVMAEKEFSVNISPSRIAAAKSVADLLNIIQNPS
jgi:acyl carrier protein